MADAAQKVENVARAVGQRGPCEQKNEIRPQNGRFGRFADTEEFQAMRGSLAVVLDEMSLVEDDARPGYGMQPFGCAGCRN